MMILHLSLQDGERRQSGCTEQPSPLEGEGLVKADSIPVNISASGMRFALKDRPVMNDILEVRMLLPAYPTVGVLVHGRIVRLEELEHGGYDASLHFIDLNDDVREVIIQYTLKRQRELIRRQRQRE